MEINNKFNVGDIVYTPYKGKEVCECEVCGGHKEITILTINKENITIPCPECKGSGIKVFNNITKVSPPVMIRGIKVGVNSRETTINYKLNEYFVVDGNGFNIKSRTERHIFNTAKEVSEFIENGGVF